MKLEIEKHNFYLKHYNSIINCNIQEMNNIRNNFLNKINVMGR